MMKLKKTTLLVSGVLTACMASGALAATPEENRRDIDTITDILTVNEQILTLQHQKVTANKEGIEELKLNKADKSAVEENQRDIGTITQILGVTEQILTAQNQKSDELLADIVSNSEQILENEGNIERNSAAIETNKANIDLLTPAVLENTVGVETNKAAVETVKQELAGKANAADVYAKAEVYNKTEADGKFAEKAAVETVKQELAGKANAADVYAKAEVYNKTEADNLFALKANAQDVSGLTKRVDTVETALAGKADKAQVDALSNRVGKLEKDTRRGLATQAALAGLFQPYKVGRVNISAAVGGYKSESAVAVGAGYRFSEQFAAKLGVAANSGGTAYNFGVNYEF
ncbi:YadA C-terminal domain-containing protein [Neisseria leonii]|uniref:YadA C-terminal domain-containing protein n=1 Tax=Neisseria leonii TaxID=2995413 RepID=A0AAQ3V0L1_9NEIS